MLPAERRKIVAFLKFLLKFEVSPAQIKEIEAGIRYWSGLE